MTAKEALELLKRNGNVHERTMNKLLIIEQSLDELEELKKQLQGNTLRNRNLILETSNKLLKEDLETKNKLLDLYRELLRLDKSIRNTMLDIEKWNISKKIIEVRNQIKELEEEMK